MFKDGIYSKILRMLLSGGQNFAHGFVSPTYGSLTFDAMFERLMGYVSENGGQRYRLIIGTDSFLNSETLFVSAVIIHKIGHGGRYFYKKTRHRKIESMRQRIFYETAMSIELASIIRERLDANGFSKMRLEIHLDVGTNGDTKEIIKEVVGMVTGSGYPAVTKPDSFGASNVADRHSR